MSSLDIPYFQHGSENSLDKDIVYLFQEIPSHQECLNFCKEKKEDVNIIVIQNNYVVFSYKGIIDETNNALFNTIQLHQQKYTFPKLNLMQRIVPLKVSSTILSLFIILRKKECRDEIIKSLKSFDLKNRILTLQKIDFSNISLTIEDVKFIAFRLGQTLALIYGKEIYTKFELEKEYPDLTDHLRRSKSSNILVLNKYKTIFLNEIDGVNILKSGNICTFWSKRNDNYFHTQSKGLSIDIQKDCLIYFPLCQKMNKLKCNWPVDNLFLDDINDDINDVYYLFMYESKKKKIS
eukprot:gene10190-2609_t